MPSINGLPFSSLIFYMIKGGIPRWMQIGIRRLLAQKKRERTRDTWPIDPSVSTILKGWKGWPDNKKFAFALTHDVEFSEGQAKCEDLARLDMEMGFRSSFNFVPRRYEVSPDLRSRLTRDGFEVGVHGLYHDGKYFFSKKIWRKRAALINEYIAKWNAVGFRAPSMLHDLELIHDLCIEYDASTFDTDPFEPQPIGMGSIFPFWVPATNEKQKGYVELPYTLPQDFTLFIILEERDTRIWKEKLDWIAHHGGMAMLNVHPDYINFSNSDSGNEEYPVSLYKEFLAYVRANYEGQYWNALPREIARHYREYEELKSSAIPVADDAV